MARIVLRTAVVALFALIVVSVMNAVAAANIVPETGRLDQSWPITANTLKPPECAALNLTEVVIWQNGMPGDRDSGLVLGGPGNDTIKGGKGNDCILGGGGNDSIDGNQGTDVCIGGPGTDTFKSCATWYQRLGLAAGWSLAC